METWGLEATGRSTYVTSENKETESETVSISGVDKLIGTLEILNKEQNYQQGTKYPHKISFAASVLQS